LSIFRKERNNKERNGKEMNSFYCLEKRRNDEREKYNG
jgi:hypothetical protein